MNAPHLAPDRRAIHQPNAMPPPLWMPPQATDPGYAEWYARQECLDATYREIPHDRYDYFEEIGHD